MRAADVYIDVTSVPELSQHMLTNNKLLLGGNVTLSDTMDIILELSKDKEKEFGYLKNVWDHIDVVANVPVRNVSIAYRRCVQNLLEKTF